MVQLCQYLITGQRCYPIPCPNLLLQGVRGLLCLPQVRGSPAGLCQGRYRLAVAARVLCKPSSDVCDIRFGLILRSHLGLIYDFDGLTIRNERIFALVQSYGPTPGVVRGHRPWRGRAKV
ncbi:hypothetical protein D3C84_690560 [compost metagenome]